MLSQIAASRSGAKSLMRALDRMMVQLVNSDPVVDRLMNEQVRGEGQCQHRCTDWCPREGLECTDCNP